MFFGRERLIFTNNSSDDERITASYEEQKYIDNKPLNITEVKAWNLRPRYKDLEIGPVVRHKPMLQMERIYDKLISKTSPVFA